MGDIASGLFTSIISAIIILVVGIWASKYIKKLIVAVMNKKNIEFMLVSFTSSIAYIALVAFVIIAALEQLGIQTTSFVAIIGAAGLAIALSLQSSLSNFASGIMIIFFRPFKVGDFIESSGTSGVVEGIHVFSTQMRTGDNKMIIIPNSKITGGNIVNYSSKAERRIDLTFGIGYDDDLKKAKEVLTDIIKQEERILANPEPLIAVSELADSSVNFVVRPWVNTADYWPVYFGLTETVKLRFDEEGISIPYPQRDVHLHQAGQQQNAA